MIDDILDFLEAGEFFILGGILIAMMIFVLIGVTVTLVGALLLT